MRPQRTDFEQNANVWQSRDNAWPAGARKSFVVKLAQFMGLVVALLVATASACTAPPSEEGAQQALPDAGSTVERVPLAGAHRSPRDARTQPSRSWLRTRGQIATAWTRPKERTGSSASAKRLPWRPRARSDRSIRAGARLEAPPERATYVGYSRVPSSRRGGTCGRSQVLCGSRSWLRASANHRRPCRVPDGAVHEGCASQEVSSRPGYRA